MSDLMELAAVGLGIFGGFCLGYILGIKDGFAGLQFVKSLRKPAEKVER